MSHVMWAKQLGGGSLVMRGAGAAAKRAAFERVMGGDRERERARAWNT